MSYANVEPLERKYRVGVLGATGAVGQRFIELLENHPWFEVTALGASERNKGKLYKDAVNWKISSQVPEYARELPIFDCSDTHLFEPLVDVVFSGLDSSVAGTVEDAFAEAGVSVFSNAKNHRMDPNVPILIPVINADHVEIVRAQKTYKQSGGYIITNANCSSTGLSVALKPIQEAFGIEEMVVCTLQAISGAGYPGLPSLDIIDNCVPYISGEEDKLEIEPSKILGTPTPEGFIKCVDIRATAMCHRVAVTDGHTVSVTLKLARGGDNAGLPKEELARRVRQALEDYDIPKIVKSLPSCPKAAIIIKDEPDRPQPRLDRHLGGGQSTVVGRVRACGLNDVKLVTLSHNTIIGAAGGSILNAELALSSGLVRHRDADDRDNVVSVSLGSN